MSTSTLTAEERFTFHHANWEFYETVLAHLADRRVFVTYDRGTLEIMSPSSNHEACSELLGGLIRELALERNIPIRGGGSTTFRREDLDRGLEPHKCYWIQNEARVRGSEAIDLTRDPPPDLAVEIEISARLLDRESIYAALGVPELWRFDGETLRIYVLRAAGYEESAKSRALPMIPVVEITRFLAMRKTTDDTTLIRAYRDWIRATLGAS